jgi:DNA-binding HxlR family transcriptional regulator
MSSQGKIYGKRSKKQTMQKQLSLHGYCPLSIAPLKLIGGKWKIPICVLFIHDGTTRYNEMKRKISGITNTMLAIRSESWKKTPDLPHAVYGDAVKVEYALTGRCSELIPILNQLAHWGVQVSYVEISLRMKPCLSCQ